MKVVIFGIGEIYRQNKDKISKEDEIVAFLDNNEYLQGTTNNGIAVYSPSQIDQIVYDKIVIMSSHANEMKNQLLNEGCSRTNILHYLEYIGKGQSGKPELFPASQSQICDNKVLIITSELGYHGGAVTAVYAALALKGRGYEVVIAAPDGSERFIEEYKKKGITFIIYTNLKYAKYNELLWINNFQEIIVNTYPMILCALEISRNRRVSIWLHESDIIYNNMEFWSDIVAGSIINSKLNVYAVSNVARENFINNITKCEIGLLSYGIPDLYEKTRNVGDKLTFAVIATIHHLKQQLLYLDALETLDKCYQNSHEFLIIGKVHELDYAHKVEKKAETFPNVSLIGELTRDEMESMYNQIDIVVVSSSRETMSLVATEAMMYGKVCIVCDAAGIAEFINHGENGLIYKTNNADSLAQQMRFCIENKDILVKIGKNARKTYSKYFTMEGFGNRLQEMFSSRYTIQ